MNIEIGINDIVIGIVLGISLTICAQIGFIKWKLRDKDVNQRYVGFGSN